MKVKKQHYVPRSYLARFAPDGVHVPTLFLKTERIATPNKEDLACEGAFYDVEQFNKRAVELGCPSPQLFEAFYGDEEVLAKETITKLLERFSNGDMSPISKTEIPPLASVVITQHLRTRRARDGAEERVVWETIDKLIAQGISEESIDDIEIRIVDEDTRKKEHLLAALNEESINRSFFRLIKMGWVVLQPPAGRTFNSSDHPAVMKQVHYPQEGVMFYFPLSPTFALAIGDRIRAPLGIGVKGVQIVTVRQLHYLNSLQARGCTNQVYSFDFDFTAARASITSNRHFIG